MARFCVEDDRRQGALPERISRHEKGRPTGARWEQTASGRSEDRIAAVGHSGELGLMQAPGLEDLLADEGEVVHNVPPQRQPRSLLPRHASPEGMNVLKQ